MDIHLDKDANNVFVIRLLHMYFNIVVFCCMIIVRYILSYCCSGNDVIW